MREKKEKVLSFKVEPQHKKKLEVLAHETRRSQSAVIRELIVTAQPDQPLKPTAQLPAAEVVRMSAEAKRKNRRALHRKTTRIGGSYGTGFSAKYRKRDFDKGE